MSKLSSVLKAAGITPDAYRVPEIVLDEKIIAEEVATYLNQQLRSVPNHAYDNELPADAAGFKAICEISHVNPDDQPSFKSRKGHLTLAHDLVVSLQDAAGSGFLAFASPNEMTKRKTDNHNAKVGNVIVQCALWWDSDERVIGISLKTVVLASA